jgi:hypothetical protein
MNIFSDYVVEFPLISAIIRSARDAVAANKSLSVVDEELKRFLCSDEPVLIMNKCVAELAANPDADPPFMTDGHIMLCNDFGGLAVAIGRTEAATSQSPLYSSTSEALLGCLSSEGFSYRFHDIPADWNPEVFSLETRLGAPQQRHCAWGETVLAPPTSVFDYASSGSLVLKIVAPSKVGLMWEFSRADLTAMRVHAATLQSTTVSFILRFLSKYGNQDSVGAISHLVTHPFHHVRWDVAKALGQCDVEALSIVLDKLKDDPHPHVRAASQKTLAQMGDA